jgi:transcriptional regulator with XRE-family HTH domain
MLAPPGPGDVAEDLGCAVRDLEARTFGEVLKHERLAAGLTQEELAERASISARAISDLERSVKHTPRRQTVKLLADALRLSDGRRTAFAAAARPPRVWATVTDRPPILLKPVHNLPAELTSFVGRERQIADRRDRARRTRKG